MYRLAITACVDVPMSFINTCVDVPMSFINTCVNVPMSLITTYVDVPMSLITTCGWCTDLNCNMCWCTDELNYNICWCTDVFNYNMGSLQSCHIITPVIFNTGAHACMCYVMHAKWGTRVVASWPISTAASAPQFGHMFIHRLQWFVKKKLNYQLRILL